MQLQLLAILSLPLLTFASQEKQVPMTNNAPYSPLTNSKPTLTDLLTIEPSASIFYSYARELELSSLFSNTEAKSTLFVPTNKAVMALTRKPHEGPNAPIGGGIEISDEEFDRNSKKNVQRWISAHIIPESPITLDSNEHNTLLPGKALSFKQINKIDSHLPEWSRVTLEDGIHIIDMKEGLNGVLFLIDGAILSD